MAVGIHELVSDNLSTKFFKAYPGLSVLKFFGIAVTRNAGLRDQAFLFSVN